MTIFCLKLLSLAFNALNLRLAPKSVKGNPLRPVSGVCNLITVYLSNLLLHIIQNRSKNRSCKRPLQGTEVENFLFYLYHNYFFELDVVHK